MSLSNWKSLRGRRDRVPSVTNVGIGRCIRRSRDLGSRSRDLGSRNRAGVYRSLRSCFGGRELKGASSESRELPVRVRNSA